MILFRCEICDQQLYFESTSCTRCGSTLGYLPHQRVLRALTDSQSGDGPRLTLDEGEQGGDLRLCANAGRDACNWLVSQGGQTEYCESCSLSEIIPDLSVPENERAWKRLEAAKRRLLFTLYALDLPVVSRAEAPETGLAFRFLQGTKDNAVVTGHDSGTITLNCAEAHPAYREKQRERLDEKYRTPLGHLRHEVGHYYFDRLIDDAGRHESFRKLFGDERLDYAKALERHYEQGPPSEWQETHISAYATMHPWEDWAETFAHYLHMVDTLETARSYGVSVRSPGGKTKHSARAVDSKDFDALMEGFHVVTLALNGLNRSMGQPDAYPFAISPNARAKLGYVHDVVMAGAPRADASPPVGEARAVSS